MSYNNIWSFQDQDNQEINLYQYQDYHYHDVLSRQVNRSHSQNHDCPFLPIYEIGQSTCQKVDPYSNESFLMHPQFQSQDEYKQQNNDADDTLEIFKSLCLQSDNQIINLKDCQTPAQNIQPLNFISQIAETPFYDDNNNNNNINSDYNYETTFYDYNNNNIIANYNDETTFCDNNNNININADQQSHDKLIFSNKRCNQINSKQKYKEKFANKKCRQRKAMKRKDKLQIHVRDNDNTQSQIQAVCRARLMKNNIRYIMNKGIRSIRNINKEYYRSLCSQYGLPEDAIATTIYGYLDKSIEFLKKQWLSPSKENIVFRKLSYYYLHKQAIRGILNGRMKNKILYLQSLDLLKESVKNPQLLEQGNFPDEL